MCVRECICIYVVSEGVQTRQLPPTPPSLAGWPGRRKRDRRCHYDHLIRPLSWWRLDRKDRSCCWLSQGRLAMPTMLYYVAVSGAKLPTVSDQSNTKIRHG